MNSDDCSMNYNLCLDPECDEKVETFEDNPVSKYNIIYEVATD